MRHRPILRTAIARFVAMVGALAVGAAPMHAQDSGAGALPPPSASQGLQLAPATEPLDAYSTIPAAPAEQVAPMPGDGLLDDAVAGVTPVYGWYHPAFWLGPDPWNAGVEIGVNGSQGINDVLSLRSGGHLKRETKRYKLDSSLVYNKNVGNGVETQHNAKLDARLDRILAESSWTLFNLNNFIYDEFQAYDLQASLNGGVGYQWIKNDFLDLMTRLGAGATREFGGPDDEWKPTALAGVDYTHKVTATQRLAAKIDYYPEWEDFRRYRVVSDLGWVIDLDSPKNVSLKLSLIDRYDSTPNGVKPNSFDYAVLLIWGL